MKETSLLRSQSQDVIDFPQSSITSIQSQDLKCPKFQSPKDKSFGEPKPDPGGRRAHDGWTLEGAQSNLWVGNGGLGYQRDPTGERHLRPNSFHIQSGGFSHLQHKIGFKWSSRNPRCLVCNDFSCTTGCYEEHLQGFPCCSGTGGQRGVLPISRLCRSSVGGLGVWMELWSGNYRSAMYFFYACYHYLSPTSFWSPHRSKTNKPPTCPESLWHMTRHHYLRWFAIGIHPNDQGDELDTSLEMYRLIWAACNFLDGQLNQPTNQRTCGFLWLNDSGGLRRSLGRQVLLYLCHRQLSCESLGIHISFASDFLFSRFSMISLQCQFTMMISTKIIWPSTFAELTIHSTEC